MTRAVKHGLRGLRSSDVGSQRKDKRGHWPSGKRRNADKGDWTRIRLSLARLLQDHPRYGQISARALARDLSCSDRSVRRWITGVDRPSEDTQAAIQQWVAEWRDLIRLERRHDQTA